MISVSDRQVIVSVEVLCIILLFIWYVVWFLKVMLRWFSISRMLLNSIVWCMFSQWLVSMLLNIGMQYIRLLQVLSRFRLVLLLNRWYLVRYSSSSVFMLQKEKCFYILVKKQMQMFLGWFRKLLEVIVVEFIVELQVCGLICFQQVYVMCGLLDWFG